MRHFEADYSLGDPQGDRVLPQHEAGLKLEHAFGDPWNREKPFSFSSSLDFDEASMFPWDWGRFLDRWGANAYFVPKVYGGRLGSFEEMVNVFRVIFRRDPTLGLGYGATTFMASVPVWVAGNDAQKRRLARVILNREAVSVAYHERAHGNDLLGNEVSALKVPNGYRLNGEKWVINNATRSRALTLFARTSQEGGGRGFSVLLLDKNEIDALGYRYLAKVKTHGVRGCQIGGIRFENCHVPDSGVVGTPGQGMEISLRAFQITRTVLPGMALGCAETALRMALRFVLDEKASKPESIPLSLASDTLIRAFLDLIVCECVAVSASRALHVIPEQMSLYSAIVKYFVPSRLQSLIKNLSKILGVQGFLREGEYGIFQKFARDFPVVALGHASSVICLASMIPQLKAISQQRLKRRAGDPGIRDRFETLFNLESNLPEFESARLALNNRKGRDDVVFALDLALEDLANIPIKSSIQESILKSVIKLRSIIEEFDLQCANMPHPSTVPETSWYRMAERYAVIHSACACVHYWHRNYRRRGGFFSHGAWLALALDSMLGDLGAERDPSVQEYRASILDELHSLYYAQKQFSLTPLRLSH